MNILNKIFTHIRYKTWLYYHVVIPQFYFSLRLGKTILEGPFKGIKYNLSSIGSVLTPKLIGTYEHEINTFFTAIFLSNYERFIDVGAAEGYYVVGARSLNKDLKIVAFETSLKGQQQIKKNLSINQIWDPEKVSVKGYCDPDDLTSLLKAHRKTFLLCDIEGYEKILLDPEKVPSLLYCDVLVEIHFDINPDIEEIIYKRFIDSHNISHIKTAPKLNLKNNYTDEFILKNFNYLSNEFRKNEAWLYLKAK